ncbi:MAG: chromosomal replication initiator protein DnaA [Actinomycetota bacterium]
MTTYSEIRERGAATESQDPAWRGSDTQTLGDAERAAELWGHASQLLRNRISRSTFSMWFGRAQALGIEDTTFVLGVPNPYAKEQIESRYLEPLTQSLASARGEGVDVVLLAGDSFSAEEDEEPLPPTAVSSHQTATIDITSNEGSAFHPKYSFDSFVIGSSNRFAHAAALAVAEGPAKAYNPLFIYGGSGLGKTHLLHAVGRYVGECHPALRACYVTTEQFMNEFILALQRRTITEFHRRYRAVDLLMVDDIQFLEGKERTQEEFFHTFNALHPHSQVVITSDRPPKKISTLEERLRTRFEWGLITDIQPPDLETRIAILQMKAETDGLTVSPEVMDFIASRIQTNIRELEGALIRVAAYASLTSSEPTLELAQGVLQSLLPNAAEARVTPDLVIAVAAEYYDITPDEIRSSNRSRPLVNARQMAMYLCRELTDLSLPEIGRRFGGRDHSTVLHANNKIRRQMQERQSSFEQVRELTTRVRQRATRA